ncbi:hypothetical protein M1146_03935 [Patescibacteria group bacterium]|nr:hypothetical protein [Patescibacteria group bacterium]
MISRATNREAESNLGRVKFVVDSRELSIRCPIVSTIVKIGGCLNSQVT